jgi:hypothetical protein
MPNNKPYKNDLSGFHIAQSEDIALLFYYVGIREVIPNLSDTKICKMFLSKMKLEEEDYPLKTALQVLCRMKTRYLKY